MRKRNINWKIIIPFIVVTLLISIVNNEDLIREKYGEGVFILIFAVFTIIIVAAFFFPVIKIMKKTFSSDGYRFFWSIGKKATKVLETGHKGIATVIDISETKGGIITINEQPVISIVLKIEDNNSQIYKVEFDVLMPRIRLPLFQQGAVFPVRIDINDKNKIVYDKERVYELNNPIIGSEDWAEDDLKIIKDYGIEAFATLLSIEDTGISENFMPIVKFIYDIHIEGEKTYRIEKDIPVKSKNALSIKNLTGKSFKAKVNPIDKNKVIVNLIF